MSDKKNPEYSLFMKSLICKKKTPKFTRNKKTNILSDYEDINLHKFMRKKNNIL